MNIGDLKQRVYATAMQHGWWDKDRPIPECLCLIHSEVSEALESYRRGERPLHVVDGKPEGIASELADVIIRVLDLCAGHKLPIEEAIEAKCAYNDTRPYRHGGKRC